MSRKPNTEANSLDYAEAPLTFNSVETILVLNASAAFMTNGSKVFLPATARLTRNLNVRWFQS